MHSACHDYSTFNGSYKAEDGGPRGECKWARLRQSEADSRRVEGRVGGRAHAHAKMKANAINKIYKIINSALGITLIATQPDYAERRFLMPGHFGSLRWNSGKGERI